jgi:hypothetical protein
MQIAPFTLSLSKGEEVPSCFDKPVLKRGSWFDKLTTNGAEGLSTNGFA